MKERENREFWIRQTTTLLAMSINRYLCIALCCFVFPLPGFFGFGRILTPPEPNGPINSCQGKAPGPLERRGGKAWQGHGWARRSGGFARSACGSQQPRRQSCGSAPKPRGSRWGPTVRRRALGQRVRIAAELRLGAAELRELNRIGVNLNQMARALNSRAVSSPVENPGGGGACGGTGG